MNLVKIKDVCKINPPKEKVDGKVSFLRMEDVSVDGRVLNKEEREYSEVSTGFSAFKDKDILVAKITPCFENGKGAYVENLLNGIGFGSTEFHVIRADESKLLSKYLFYHLNSEIFRKYGEIHMTGSAGQKRIPRDYIENYKIFLPSLLEQKKIVSIISSWDLAIEKQGLLIEKKKEFKKGLIQRLLSGEVRFKEFNDEWKRVKLKDIIEESKEKSTENNQFDILSVTKDGIVLQSEYFNRQVASENNTGYKVVRKNNLVFSSMNLWMGSIDILTRFEVGIVSPACKVFNVNLDKIDINYFKILVRSKKMINLYNINSEQGASVVRRNLDLVGLLNSKIYIPSIEEQRKMGLLFKDIDNEIELLEKELEALKLQKKGLMQRLLTGEVRVKV